MALAAVDVSLIFASTSELDIEDKATSPVASR